MAEKKVSTEALKEFVRREASAYLARPNVTSIGVGYKVKAGTVTDELAIQFTVAQKLQPEALAARGLEPLPESVEIDGVTIPVDVLERDYRPAAREVALAARLEAAAPRKTAVDPIVPGVSIGHPSISAGTAGCAVYDAVTGARYVLSNWHVLHGARGAIGDPIVQPGRHDDNRVDRNVVGRLVRSHLGRAGDCAIATIESRGFDPKILDLGVAVERIGEPDLGDRVVKSGRTTAVTFGTVQRIHTIASINYDGVGVQEIGGFEIGPDPDHPAENDEISMGGDSGSAWMFVQRGRASDMMVGLHFAGEVGNQPEHALACYAASVFEKLGITPTKPAAIVAEDVVGLGYAPGFLTTSVEAPAPASDEVKDDLLKVEGRAVFDYVHFSLAMSRSRRFARWVAWNIDGTSMRRISRSGIDFKKDPKLPGNAQVGNEIYSNNPLDRGHIARRADLLWGTMPEARRANVDSFFYTNITPQHEAFNQSAANGIWGELEDAIFAEIDVQDLRISVMGGPIFADDDPVFRQVKLPRQFWKVVYYTEAGAPGVKAKGYVLTQADLLTDLRVLSLPEFSVFEVPICEIGKMTGLDLAGDSTREAARRRGREPGPVDATGGSIRRITSVREIVR